MPDPSMTASHSESALVVWQDVIFRINESAPVCAAMCISNGCCTIALMVSHFLRSLAILFNRVWNCELHHQVAGYGNLQDKPLLYLICKDGQIAV